jgi:hypothetical protein
VAAANGPGGFPTINQGARTLEGDSSKRALLRDGEVRISSDSLSEGRRVQIRLPLLSLTGQGNSPQAGGVHTLESPSLNTGLVLI